ncbi:SCO5555 family protein, partial [Streptomyces globisporus]
MERDSQLKLYGQVADRLKEAHAKVRALQVPEGVRMALTRKQLPHPLHQGRRKLLSA